MRRFLLVCVFMACVDPALACKLGDMPRRIPVLELAAIDQGLATTALGEAERKAIRELREKAAITSYALSSEGLRLQSEYRLKALQRLGLKPIGVYQDTARVFWAIDKAEANASIQDGKVEAVVALRAKVVSQWLANDYKAAHATLSEARELLGIKLESNKGPRNPKIDFLEIDRAVANAKNRDEKIDTVVALRAKAESQLRSKDVAAGLATLSQALKLLGIEEHYYQNFRC